MDPLSYTIDLLKESEEKFRIAFKISPDALNINRLTDGMYIEINEGFTQLTGYTWEDVEGKTSDEISIWADKIGRQKLISRLMETGKVSNIEAKFRLKNGDIQTGLMSASIIKFKSDTFILSVTRNIEEIVQARAIIKENEEKFRQLTDNLNDVFWLTENDKVLYVNPAIRQFGFTQEEFLKDIDFAKKVVHPEDFGILEELRNIKYATEGTPISREIRIFDRKDQIHWLWIRMFPVLGKSSEPNRIAGIISDITFKKQIESELREAKEKAQESDRLKSAFLANLSHEIRTPMTGIIGFMDLLSGEIRNTEINRHYVDIIQKCNEQLLHIIDDLVDISKIEANQLKLTLQECNIHQLLEDLYFIYEQKLKTNGKKTIQLVKEIPDISDGPVIITDEFRLRQVLMNLLNNALKFTKQGKISFGYEWTNSDHIRIFVTDTGIGIPEEKKEIIFKPFRQIDSDLNKNYSGTGLGLSICKGLASLLGGQIFVESKLGEGSSFSLILPCNQTNADTVKNHANKYKEEYYNWDGKKVLIVEDDDWNFEFLQEILGKTGLHIKRARNGLQATKEAVEFISDLIIMDIRLPIMNGLEATKIIREKGIKTPIIAQTAYAMSEDKEICLAAGCDDYVSKPVHKDLLLKKIAYHLHKKSIFPSL